MAITRYTDGGVTVTLDDGLERFVRRALEAAHGETVRIMEQAAEEVASKARAEWYAPGTGVNKRTGRSGDIQVVTTVDAGKGEVRVSVGSTDTGKVGSKPRVVLIHRAGRLSLVDKVVDQEEYNKTPKPLRVGRVDGKFVIKVHNPNASDGKYLLNELVKKPARLKIKDITPALGKAISARMGGSNV